MKMITDGSKFRN